MSGTPSKAKSKLTTITYNRLHFDVNRDLDLTNDPVVEPEEKPSTVTRLDWTAKQQVIFRPLAIPFDFGPGLGARPVNIMPRLLVEEVGNPARMFFVATTARQGTIRLGTESFAVFA